jgi:hypothetical protein
MEKALLNKREKAAIADKTRANKNVADKSKNNVDILKNVKFAFLAAIMMR